MTAAYFPDSPSRWATGGISNDPGTRTTSARSSATPCRRRPSRAPATSASTTIALNRAATTANRPAGGGREVAFEGGHQAYDRVAREFGAIYLTLSAFPSFRSTSRISLTAGQSRGRSGRNTSPERRFASQANGPENPEKTVVVPFAVVPDVT